MREFMQHLTRPAPPGFRAPTIESVLKADKELWTRVADQVRSNLRPDKDDKLPVDTALLDLYQSASVVFHLLPLLEGRQQRPSANIPKKRKLQRRRNMLRSPSRTRTDGASETVRARPICPRGCMVTVAGTNRNSEYVTISTWLMGAATT